MLFDCQSFVLHLCMITTNSIGYLRLILIKVVSGAQVVLMLEQSRFDAYLAVDAVWKTASVPLRVCSAATSLLGLCAARPTSRLFLGPRALRFLYTAVTAHGALTFSLPHNHITTPPHVVPMSITLPHLMPPLCCWSCTLHVSLPCFHISDCRYTAASPSLFLCCQSAMLSQFHTPVFHWYLTSLIHHAISTSHLSR